MPSPSVPQSTISTVILSFLRYSMSLIRLLFFSDWIQKVCCIPASLSCPCPRQKSLSVFPCGRRYCPPGSALPPLPAPVSWENRIPVLRDGPGCSVQADSQLFPENPGSLLPDRAPSGLRSQYVPEAALHLYNRSAGRRKVPLSFPHREGEKR